MNYIERFKEVSNRECEVLDLCCQGMTYREIGERLFISIQGVKSHMHNIYVKLGLIGLPPKARAFTLREEYWPLVKERLEKVDVSQPEELGTEPEIIEPIPSEVEEMIDQDQKAMKALVVSEPMQLQPPVRPRRRFRPSCFSVVLLLLVVSAVAFWYFDGLAAVQSVLASANPSPTQHSELAGSGLSPTQRSTSAPTKVPTNTRIPTKTTPPLPTRTPTPRPSPTYNFGPIYELGEWHKEGDLWFRLFSYEVDWEGIYVLVEMWNQSSQTVYFHWATVQNTFLRDNQGNRYEVDSRFDQKDDDEIVPANTKMFIGAAPYDDQWTNWFDPDNLFLPGVTDLYFTLEYFSKIERATWHISVGS
ncbi:MAG: helix-turn-helix transcriptional regulator [Anaerolineales bacterium]